MALNTTDQLIIERTGTLYKTTAAEIKTLVSASPTFTGTVVLPAKQQIIGTVEKKVAMAALNIDLSAGNVFTKTAATNSTFTVSNVPTTSNTASFILELTNGGAYTITWWSGVKTAGGTAITLTTSGLDILGFYTHDGGTTWRMMMLSKDSK